MDRTQPLIANAGVPSSQQSNQSRGDLEMNLPNGTAAQQSMGKNSWMSFSWLGSSRHELPRTEEKLRKVPTKVEPKVFFSNERTFLSWLNMAVTLSTISLAVAAFADANKMSQVYGICLLPVSISFILYALYTYMRRATMIRNKDPGPYEDRRGPVFLACLLAVSIVVNFSIKMYEITH